MVLTVAGSSESPVRVGRYRWYALGVLTLAQTCHALDRSIIGLVLEPVGQEFSLSDGQLGALAGLAYGLAFAVAAIPLGLAVDRFNRRNILIAMLALWSGFTALCGLANSYVALLLSRASVGASEAGGNPTGLSLLSDYFPPSERSTAVGIWYMGGGFGAFLAFLCGGYVVEHYGWREAFFIAGMPGLAIALLLFLTLKEPRRGGADSQQAAAIVPGLLPGLRLMAAQPGLFSCMVGMICVAIFLSGTVSWIASFFVRTHGLSMSQTGLVAAMAFGLLGPVGSALSGAYVDRLHRRAGAFDPRRPALSAAITSFITAVLALVTLLSVSTPVAIAFLMLCGLMASAYTGPANSLFVTLAPPQIRGLTVSILQFGSNLVGMGLGPLIVGAVSESVGGDDGLRWGLIAVFSFSVLGTLQFALVARGFGRREPS